MPVLSDSGWDMRRPDLTNAIHWLVDDTWWDTHDPSKWIGLTLRDTNEADGIRRVVATVLDVADRVGGGSPDAEWFADALWPLVRSQAAEGLELLGDD